jgi:hypothetical protein
MAAVPDRDVPLWPTHSYQRQDRFVLEVLNGLRGGFFLDSGAANGVRGSNTLLLERDYGWRGICVEPNDAMYADLVAHRDCLCYHCCLDERDGEVEFLESGGVFGGILRTYSASHLAFARRMIAEGDPELRNPSLHRSGAVPAADPQAAVLKPARSLRSILRESDAPPVIDYWSLDTEGSELALLRSFPFDAYRFRVLTVEHNSEPARWEIRRFLESRGYVLARELGIDDGYIHRDDDRPHRNHDSLGEDGFGDNDRARPWRSAAWRSRR